jgi:hypothetical protein
VEILDETKLGTTDLVLLKYGQARAKLEHLEQKLEIASN